MLKAILFDADGVTLLKHRYFSEKFSEEHGVPLKKILPFFQNEFRICQRGQADLKEELHKYLPEWSWRKSIDEFLEYWFEEDTLPDQEVLAYIQELRKRGVKCYLTTDQEKYRGDYLLNNLGFKEKFDAHFFSHELGCTKSQREFFEKMLGTLRIEPKKILYIDDDQENLEVAAKTGIAIQLYEGIDSLKKLSTD